MLSIEPFRLRHLRDIPMTLTLRVLWMIRAQVRGGPSFTVRDTGNSVVACGGIIINGTCGDIWMCVHQDRAARCPVAFSKTIHHIAQTVIAKEGLRSLQTTVDSHDPVAVRFANRFGLSWEFSGKTPQGIVDIYAREF
ncbi:MAG: hypothetical protein ABFD60_07780 [Bryobacteraceae bacterium]